MLLSQAPDTMTQWLETSRWLSYLLIPVILLTTAVTTVVAPMVTSVTIMMPIIRPAATEQKGC